MDEEFKRYLYLFSGREDYFARQGQNYYHPINSAFDPYYLQLHFDGTETYGVYVLTSESNCNFFCIDLDIPKADLASVDFADRKAKYQYLSDSLYKILKIIRGVLKIPQEAILLEDSGGRGYHIWLFLEEPTAGIDAVRFHAILKSLVNVTFEFFPKQANLRPKRKLGNLIKLPLGVHRKYGSRSAFF